MSISLHDWLPSLTRWPLAVADEFVIGAFVAAAALVVIGWLLLQAQRNRQQFQLMREALERGISRFPFPAGPPYWLVSLRQGVMTLTLGVALAGVGAASYVMGSGVAMPAPTTRPAFGEFQGSPQGPPQRPGERSMDDGGPMRGDPEQGPGWRPPGFGGGPPRNNGPQMAPPPPNPAMESWHRAQVQLTFGMILMPIGGALILLGSVRAVFASIERRFAAETSAKGQE